MDEFARALVDGHLVTWKVRHIRWCTVCEQRESTVRGGLWVRCEADGQLLVDSTLRRPPQT